MLAVSDFQTARETLLFEIGTGQVDGRGRQVDPGHARPAPGEAHEVHAGAAADFENHSPAPPVKVDEPKQVVELFEMILVEIVEEPSRADRVSGNFKIVDVGIPVFAHLRRRRHGRHYSSRMSRS